MEDERHDYAGETHSHPERESTVAAIAVESRSTEDQEASSEQPRDDAPLSHTADNVEHHAGKTLSSEEPEKSQSSAEHLFGPAVEQTAPVQPEETEGSDKGAATVAAIFADTATVIAPASSSDNGDAAPEDDIASHSNNYWHIRRMKQAHLQIMSPKMRWPMICCGLNVELGSSEAEMHSEAKAQLGESDVQDAAAEWKDEAEKDAELKEGKEVALGPNASAAEHATSAIRSADEEQALYDHGALHDRDGPQGTSELRIEDIQDTVSPSEGVHDHPNHDITDKRQHFHSTSTIVDARTRGGLLRLSTQCKQHQSQKSSSTKISALTTGQMLWAELRPWPTDEAMPSATDDKSIGHRFTKSGRKRNCHRSSNSPLKTLGQQPSKTIRNNHPSNRQRRGMRTCSTTMTLSQTLGRQCLSLQLSQVLRIMLLLQPLSHQIRINHRMHSCPHTVQACCVRASGRPHGEAAGLLRRTAHYARCQI
ncbi:hypothetical protein MRB53_038707 [Persea americana]|nr:hypothetical protein MRB53_038707 [Persea americana]